MLTSHSWSPKSLIYLILIAFESGGNTNIANFNKGIKQASKCLFFIFLLFLVAIEFAINAQKMKSSIKDFFSKCDQKLCGYGHIY